MKSLLLVIACLVAFGAKGQIDKLPPWNGSDDSVEATSYQQLYYLDQAYQAAVGIIRDTLGGSVKFPDKDSITKATWDKPMPDTYKKGNDIVRIGMNNGCYREYNRRKKYSNTLWQWSAIMEGNGAYLVKSYAYTPTGTIFWQIEVRYEARIGSSPYYKEDWRVLNLETSDKDFSIHRFESNAVSSK
jgi:hypothetical protein